MRGWEHVKQQRYSPEVKERAVRLLREQRANYWTVSKVQPARMRCVGLLYAHRIGWQVLAAGTIDPRHDDLTLPQRAS